MNTEELDKVIGKAAYVVAELWPGVIEADDLQQELWVKVLESTKYMDRMVTSDPALRMELLKRMGFQIAGRYVNDYELFSGNAFYGTEHVRNLLEAEVLTINRSDLAAMNETLTEYLDIHESFAALRSRNTRYADLIWSMYVDGTVSRESSSVRSTLSRAVTALTELMNQAHRRRYAAYEEGPGTREVMSNARVRVMTSTQWEGKTDA